MDFSSGAGARPIGGVLGDDPDFYLGRFFSPASGLLVGRSRPGANIEAQPRFNPRSGC